VTYRPGDKSCHERWRPQFAPIEGEEHQHATSWQNLVETGFRDGSLGEQYMRYALMVLCVVAPACVGEFPTAPSSSRAKAIVTTELKGTLEGLETVGAVPSDHYIDATGNVTLLGQFTLKSAFMVTGLTATGNTMKRRRT
jgi:hypothetical protein